MKFQIRPPGGPGKDSIVDQEIFRARAAIAESRLATEQARLLIHTARNLQTISRLMREEIRWYRQRNLTNY